MKWIDISIRQPAVLEEVFVKKDHKHRITHWKPCMTKNVEKAEFLGNGWNEKENPQNQQIFVSKKEVKEIKDKLELIECVMAQIIRILQQNEQDQERTHHLQSLIRLRELSNARGQQKSWRK